MKIKLAYLTGFALILFLSDCKKVSETKSAGAGADSVPAPSVEVTVPNKVITVAGISNSPGFVDGAGNIARFNFPAGIQLLKDGSLFVADRDNNAVRKILPTGEVSTEKLAVSNGSYPVIKPLYVGEDDRKYLHVVCATDLDAYSHSFIFNSARAEVADFSVPYTVESCLAKDPYYDVFYTSTGHSAGLHKQSSDPSTGSLKSFSADELFPPFSTRGSSFKGLFVGRNKVIYFSSGGLLFKHTTAGVTARIFETLTLGSITSIVLNGDSKTIYLAADGYIERIANGKLTRLAGPNATNSDGRDGIGFKADVNANSLALGDHETSLYFSDTKTHTIRKLMLK